MRLRLSVAVAALALATLLSSGHRFANGFVFDDVHVIADGSVIHDIANLGQVWTHHTMFASSADPGRVQAVDTYRPVPITLFMFDAAIGGRATWPYHVTNLILHILCVLGVFFAAVLWLEDRSAALYGALVFAVHPWAVEAHVWINGRSDPACLALGLGGLIAILQAERRRSIPLYLAAGAALLLGLLSKETLLFVFPALLLMPPRKGGERCIRGRAATLGVAALAYLGARAAVLGGMQAHRDAAMLGDAAKNLPWLLLDALRQSVAPERPYLRSLRDEYASLAVWQITLAALVIVAIAVVALRARKRAPLAAWSALWFFAPLVPIAIISTVLWPGFGRYLYVPLAGFAWLLAALVPLARDKIPRPSLRIGMAGLHIVLLGALAALFTRDFASSDALYQQAIRAQPQVAMGHGWLGMSLARRGDHRGALAPLMRAVQLDPDTHRYLIHAGRSVLATGDRPNAHAIAERGIRRFEGEPTEASYHLLAVNSMSQRDPERAVGHLVRCLEIWPDRPDCRDALRSLIHDPRDGDANLAALDAIVRERPSLEPLLR